MDSIKRRKKGEMKDHVFNVLKIYSLFTNYVLKEKKKRCKKEKFSKI